MSAPAGPCEWCGGRQNWTIIAGEMYVRCIDGCLPLPLEALVPPPHVGESRTEYLDAGGADGTSEMVEGVPCEGGSADEFDDLPF